MDFSDICSTCTIHLLKSGTLCLQLCAPAAVPTLSACTSRLITSTKPFHPPRYFPPCASDSAFACIVSIYKFCLLTFSYYGPTSANLRQRV